MEEEKKEECESCKRGFDPGQKTMIGLSVYILITAIYGNVKMFQYIVSLF